MGVLPGCASACAWYLQRPEESTGSPGTRVTDACELHGGTGNQTRVLWIAASILTCWTRSRSKFCFISTLLTKHLCRHNFIFWWFFSLVCVYVSVCLCVCACVGTHTYHAYLSPSCPHSCVETLSPSFPLPNAHWWKLSTSSIIVSFIDLLGGVAELALLEPGHLHPLLNSSSST